MINIDDSIHSPNTRGTRIGKPKFITPHCMVGQLTAERCLSLDSFQTAGGVSCNYAIGYDGKVFEGLPEDKISVCSSSAWNDERAVTIECASGYTDPYEFLPKVWNSLVKLTAEIVLEYDYLMIDYDKYVLNEDVFYADDKMYITFHRWFANRECPGDYFVERVDKFVGDVNDYIAFTLLNRLEEYGVLKSKDYWFKCYTKSRNYIYLFRKMLDAIEDFLSVEERRADLMYSDNIPVFTNYEYWGYELDYNPHLNELIGNFIRVYYKL